MVLLVGLGVGALILIPSLVVLFRLVLTGRLDPGAQLARADRDRRSARRAPDGSWCPCGRGGRRGATRLRDVSWLQLGAALALLGALALALPRLLTQEQPGE